MSIEEHQSDEPTSGASEAEEGLDFATEIVWICIGWALLAILGGIAFVLLSDLFAGLAV